MKPIGYVLIGLGAVALAGCVEKERTVVHDQPPAVVHERTVVEHTPAPPPVVRERDVVVADPHRTWWNAYHPGETYDPAVALSAHRLFCSDHPTDSTCGGWDWR